MKRRIHLYLALCSKNETLVGGVFEAYGKGKEGEDGKEGGGGGALVRVIEGEMEEFVKHVIAVGGGGGGMGGLKGFLWYAPFLLASRVLLFMSNLNCLPQSFLASPSPPDSCPPSLTHSPPSTAPRRRHFPFLPGGCSPCGLFPHSPRPLHPGA
jgi:hypothetical protein